MRWSREEYIAYVHYEDIGKVMFSELFGTLVGLDKQWSEQGATPEEINLSAFDFDYVERFNCGVNTGILGGYEPKVIEDNAENYVAVDRLGRTMKLCKSSATIPVPINYPIKTMDDWIKIKKFFIYDDKRIDIETAKEAVKRQKEGVLITAYAQGGFDLPRQLLGEENLCIAYYEEPELIHDIMDTVTQMTCKSLDKISEIVNIDNLSFHEDLAGKTGSLVGPNIIETFIVPYYKKVISVLKDKGTSIFSQDSDGDITKVLDCFINAGVNLTYPIESCGEMDIVKLFDKYKNKAALKGGIDKYVLTNSKEDIARELENKMQPNMQKGGVIFGLDHRIPNGVSIDNYRFYVNTAREILKKPIKDTNNNTFISMAF